MQHVRVLLMVHAEKVHLSGTANHQPHAVSKGEKRKKKRKETKKRKSAGEHFQHQMSLRSFSHLKARAIKSYFAVKRTACGEVI